MKKSAALRIIIFILGCSALSALFIFGIVNNFGNLLARSTPFPINMHSSVQANYQKDPAYMQIPPMDIQLVIDAIWDQNLNAQNLSLRLTEVNNNFIESVASVTPRPSVTVTTNPELTSTEIEDGPVSTINLTPSSTATETPIGFVASPTTFVATESPTITIESPTGTTNPPTNTIPPPTNTVSSCSQLSISGFSTGNKKVSWSVVNNSLSSLPLNSITLLWPSSNGDLSKVFVGPRKIWESSASPPSITINSSGVTLPGNSSTKIEFFFLSDSVLDGYNLKLDLNGCQISKSN